MSKTASLFDLDGQAAIVTGASSGLGWHFAMTLARAGAKVALAARRTERLGELARRIEAFDGRAIPIALDVRDRDSVARCVATAETELGPISILVNNAGLAVEKLLLDQEAADWDRVLDTNLKGAWLMTREVARRMVDLGHGGAIINIASILSLGGASHLSSYCASKGGLVGMTRALAVELARHGIRVNAVAPGYIETDMNREFLAGETAARHLAQRIPQGRHGKPEDLDGVLLLLASAASTYITGAVVVVDGGHSAKM